MITDMTVMLYVENVAVSSQFWQSLGFEEVLRQDLGDGHETALLLYQEVGAAIQIYDREFIRLTEPELLKSSPVIVFSLDIVDNLHKQLSDYGLEVSEILPYADQYYFTFVDPDGHRFTMIGELVDRPATEEELEEFDRNMRNFLPLTFDDLEQMTRPNYIFFARRTCPWSRRMAREFQGMNIRIYWVDTEGTDKDHPVRQRYHVDTVPTLIKRASNGMYIKYEAKKQSLAEFLGGRIQFQ